MKDATIIEIAKRAGVSITTVSRAINGNYPVSAASKAKIEDAIKELNYRPNAVARSLRSRKTNLLALIVPDITNTFFMEAAKGLEKEIAKDGYYLVIASTDGDMVKERQIIDALIEKRVDALVISSSDEDDKHIRICHQLGIPVVLMDRPLPNTDLPMVIWENREGSEAMTEYLINKGHRDIGIVNVCLENFNGRLREQGFRDAMEKAGLPVRKEWVSPSNFSREDSFQWALKLLKGKEVPTALFCANNIMLVGVIKACECLGITIGKDISVVSFGYSDFFFGPNVTCLYQDSYDMGVRTGEIICRKLKGEEYKEKVQILPASIREGDSVLEI